MSSAMTAQLWFTPGAADDEGEVFLRNEDGLLKVQIANVSRLWHEERNWDEWWKLVTVTLKDFYVPEDVHGLS